MEDYIKYDMYEWYIIYINTILIDLYTKDIETYHIYYLYEL